MGEAGFPGGPVGLLRQPSRPRGWSGQRDSNPRHQAWEACTLPAELCPLNAQQVYLINSCRNVKAFPACGLSCWSKPPGSGPPGARVRAQSSYAGCHGTRSMGGWRTVPMTFSPLPQKILISFKLIQRGADRASKSWSWSPNMKTLYPKKPAWLAAGLRVTCLGLIALWLLPAPAPGQSVWPAGVGPTSLPCECEVRPGNLSPPGLRSAALNRENLGRHLARPQVASRPASGFHQDVTVRPAALGRLPRRCPLPPASAFHLQTNLRQYLETWPTPGSTTSEAWPEYVPEDGEDID
jgi:hypothetical protein